MANVVKHKFTSPKADGADASLVRPSNWNDEHVLSGGTDGDFLQRQTGETDGAGWARPGYHNLTYNADFEVWGAGTSAAPTGWTLTGTGASVAKDTSTIKHGAASVALTRTTADARLVQNIAAITDFGPVAYWQGRKLVVGAWVHASQANRARVGIADGVGETTSASHSGNSTWEFLQVSRTIDPAATKVEVFVEVHTGATTARFDALIAAEGTWVAGFVPSSWRGRKVVVFYGDSTAHSQNTTKFYGPAGRDTTGGETDVDIILPFRGVARRLTLALSSTPPAGQTYTATFRKAAVDSALTCQVTSTSRFARDTSNEVEVNPQVDQAVSVKVAASASAGNHFVKGMFEYEEVPEGI